MKQRLTMKIKLFLLFISIAGLIACTPRPHARIYPGTPHFPQTDPYSVRLLRYEPRAPHIKIGEVRFTPTPDMPGYYVEGVLKEKTAAIGGHALVIVVDNFYRQAVVHGYYWPHVYVHTERVIIGVAIRFKPI